MSCGGGSGTWSAGFGWALVIDKRFPGLETWHLILVVVVVVLTLDVPFALFTASFNCQIYLGFEITCTVNYVRLPGICQRIYPRSPAGRVKRWKSLIYISHSTTFNGMPRILLVCSNESFVNLSTDICYRVLFMWVYIINKRDKCLSIVTLYLLLFIVNNSEIVLARTVYQFHRRDLFNISSLLDSA